MSWYNLHDDKTPHQYDATSGVHPSLSPSTAWWTPEEAYLSSFTFYIIFTSWHGWHTSLYPQRVQQGTPQRLPVMPPTLKIENASLLCGPV